MHPIAYALPGTDEIVERYGGSLVAKGDVRRLAGAICRWVSGSEGMHVSDKMRADLGWKTVVDRYASVAEG